MAGGYFYMNVLPLAALATLEFVNVGINTLFIAATLDGMSHYVFVVYTSAIAALILLPAPFVSLRSGSLPPLSSSIMRKIGLLALIGASYQIIGYTGIAYSSPILASAMSNLILAFTFMLAAIFRMEGVVWKKSSSKAKIIGTIVSIAGAFVVTLYKGPAIITTAPSFTTSHDQIVHASSDRRWVLGGFLLMAEYMLIPLWFIVQTEIMKEYPAEMTVICLYSFFVTFIASVVCLAAEGFSSVWKITSSTALASIICTGVLASAVNNSVRSWALRIKGPVYVAAFKPLSIAIAAAMGVLILGDGLYLGSVAGAVMISIGFYTLIWGKYREEVELEIAPSYTTPLL